MTSKSDRSIQKAGITRMAFNQGFLEMEFSWSYERQMHITFTMMMNRVLKKVCAEDEEGCRDALTRHVGLFNITPQLAPFVGDIVVFMEEMKSRGEVDGEAISNIKTALTGPLSGIGDSVPVGYLRVIVAGTGISPAQNGDMFGPIMYSLMYSISVLIICYFGMHSGCSIGFKYLRRVQTNGMMGRLLVAASILGAMVIGCMLKDMVRTTLNIKLSKVGEEVTTLRSILDGITPGLIGLGGTWMYFWLLKKKINPIMLILGTMVLGIVDAYLGILAGQDK